MTLLNFSFTKINVEKKQQTTKQISIKSGLNITNVVESQVVAGSKQKAFKISFGFAVDYEPGVGNINLEGEIIYLANEETAKEINDNWTKKKALPKQIALVVFNRILQNCNVEALILSREINLPAPIQLPKVREEPPKKASAKKK